MMNRCVSYSMFQPTNVNRGHRTWDDHYSMDRYWYNIPSIVATYKTIYPDIDIVIHISKSILSHPLYKLLTLLHDANLIKVLIHKEDCVDLKPSMWRYIELFDDNIDVLFVRDLDSVPNLLEFISNDHFTNNDNSVSTIRSHSGHNTVGTVMLAGLSSFKPSVINHGGMTFDVFYNGAVQTSWGVDQRAIIKYIFDHLSLSHNFTDYIIQGDSQNVVTPVDVNYDCIDVTTLPNKFTKHKKLFNILNDVTSWAGQPVDCKGESLYNIIQVSGIRDELTNVMNESGFNNFYGITL